VVRRPDVPDTKYKSRNVARFIGKLMYDGKRSLAERITYDAFDMIEARQKRPPLDVFEQALKNATPSLEVKPRRVGGSTYQVPVDIRRERQYAGDALAYSLRSFPHRKINVGETCQRIDGCGSWARRDD